MTASSHLRTRGQAPVMPQMRALYPRLRSWSIDHALPLWAKAGRDTLRGGFHERLSLDGTPITNVARRATVQARQTYVYAQAHLLGWYDGKALAADAVELLLTRFRSPDGKPGYVFSLAPDGSIANPARETYAHAFVLFALAWYYRLTRDTQALSAADELLAFLDEQVAELRGGYGEGLPASDDIRRQNPHMHLFEAMIALHQATGDARYLARGAEIFGLFTSRFFDTQTGSLIEYLDQDLAELRTAAGPLREPGHHYEWIWLMRHFERLSGRRVGPHADALYAHADRFGWDAQGFVVDEVNADGSVAKASRRAWPHTECLKANLVEAEEGRPEADARCAAAASRLLDTYLAGTVAGGWRDHFSPDGRLLVDYMPASTFYHVFCAVAEAERVLG